MTQLELDLQALGLAEGADVLIHCSLRQLDAVPSALLCAVQEVIGSSATVVVPAQTPQNSNTSPIFLAATKGMTELELAEYEAGMEGFDPVTSPSYGMGAFAEHVRQQPGAVRSSHPQSSFAAVGPRAAEFMAGHELHSHLGEQSPLAALYKADAVTLLLGVGYESCTALHLAENRRASPPPPKLHRCYVMERGFRVPKEFMAPDLNPACFPDLGKALDLQEFVRCGQVGQAPARILPIRETVDFAINWMDNR